MSSSRRAVAVLLSLFALLCLAAAHWFDLKQGEELLIQRKYKEAAEALAAALPTVPAGEQDRVLFLLGQAQLLAGDPAAAVTSFERLLREHPGSGLMRAGRFQAAKAHERQGDLRTAATIYREQIEQLIGLSRKEEIAATYLGLAEKAQAAEPPQHQRVVTFCDLALDLGLEPKRAAAVRLKAAEALLALGDHQQTIQRLVPLVKDLDQQSGKLRAMLALGRARRLGGDPAGARTVLRDLIAADATAAEAGDAAYEIALSYGVPAPPPALLDRAVRALADLQSAHPTHPKAKLSLFLQAQCYRHTGRSDQALAALREFLRTQGGEPLEEVPAARAMVGDVLAGQDKANDAITAWREYLAQHPAHAEWERVQRAIVDAEYGLALSAYEQGKERFGAAREAFAAFARNYPLDPRNPDVLYLLGDMLLQEEQYDAAREAFGRCVSKYPGKDQSSLAQFKIGEIYATKTFDYEKALAAYRAVTWGRCQPQAQARIRRLVQKHLHLRTERVFRTDEPPAFVLTSRNIEHVRVRVFRLDIEDYFRSTRTVGDIDRLDIEVIAPDATFDSAVPDYVRYRETTRPVPIAFQQPGAYVVKVDDGELEATTMVLVSDLALIAKSSRHEFLVFTQNRKDERPQAGVRVLLSDGSTVVAEGTTGADGVYRFKGEVLQKHDRLTVFAVDAGGSGASSIDLSGMGYSVGLTPKGYLFSDRPLYQPGQRVHLKGIVREVESGIYRLPTADGYRLQVLSPGGRLVLQRDLQFTAFGTFAEDLDLPATAELGDWRLQVGKQGRDDLAFTGGFAVAKFERPRLQLRAELAQPVVFRGEPIQGRFVASWFYGEPAAGRALVYRLQLPDGAVLEQRGTTNAAGEVEFALPTTEFAEEALAALSAELPADAVTAQVMVPVVTTEFAPTLSTIRSVYLAKEPFEVQVAILDQSGKPLARKAEAVLLRLEAAGKRRRDLVEVEVGRQQLTTGADGKAKVTFVADRGGQHRVRVTSTDRFGNVVAGDLQLTISGDDDAVKLRLLCDQETFAVGDLAKVKVVNRAGGRLALLCWQGDGILAYETRMLPAGESELELPIRPEHAPNFALALAMIDGQQLHLADREFRVLRDLRIAIEAPKTAAPGGKVDVVVRASDPQGKPVAAEVALAMVDQALLAVRGDATPAIGPFFYGQLRETGFRTASSCTWAYDAPSRPVNEALLAEERRRALREGPAGPATGGPPGDDAGIEALVVQMEDDFRRAWANAPMPQAGGGGDGSQLFSTLISQQQLQQQERGQEARSNGRTALRFATDDSTQLLAKNPALQTTEIFLNGAIGLLPTDEPRADFRETGAWISALLTDADGRATATIELPHSTTSWSLVARAVTADTWVGAGSGALETKKELQADFVGPRSLTEGDTTEFGVRAHNLTDRGVDGRVELWIRAGDQETTQGQPVTLAARGDATGVFPFTAASAGALELTLGASADDHSDSLRLPVTVVPFGIEVADGRSGSTRDQAAFELGLPAGREYTALRLWIEIGPDPGRDLLAPALGGGYQPRNCIQVVDTNLSRSSRGLAALTVLDYLEQAGSGSKVDHDRLLGLAQAMLQSLISAQRDDGSYAWIGQKNQDLRSTSQTVRFLAACRRRGMAMAEAPLMKATEWLQQALRQAGNDSRPDLLWALAAADRVRFESLNSLHRSRGSLPVDGLARLALAWHEHQRPELLAETLAALRTALPAAALPRQDLETVALAARALLLGDKRDPTGTAAVAFVQSARRGGAWGTPEATAAALQLLASVRREGSGAPSATEVSVTVNGQPLATTQRTAAGDLLLAVPADQVTERGNKITIRVQGGGEAFYSASLLGFAKGFRDEDRNDALVRIERNYLAAGLRHAHKEVPSGFSVVTGGGYQTFQNAITQLRIGESCRVHTRFWIRREPDRARMTPLVVEEPLPAGCSVPRHSIQGDFEHVDVQPDRLVFYFRDGVGSATVVYELQARFPGVYRVLPAHVFSALRPELAAHGAAGKLTVHGGDDGARDDYRLTPDELYHLGRALFDEAQSLTGELRSARVQEAVQHLEQLLADWQQRDYRLRDDVFKEVARMLLFCGIERGDSRMVVRFFEELKDRYADLVIPFDKILAVGRSYFDLGEFEAALLVFRATADASFLKDAAVATTLQDALEVKASTEFLEKLLLAYPDLNTMRVARYSIGQQLAALAAKIDPAAPVDEKVGSQAQLRQRALAAFREFLVLYPEDPLAEEVSFAWATTHLEGQDLQAALQVATAALQRYPESTFVDELLYTQGYAQFALGQHEPAFAALQRVATEEFKNAQGGRGASESKWHAIYLQGQIHHARGEPDKALLAYKQVEERFTDAGEAADYFLRKHLALPEVSTVAAAAKPEVELTFRNIERASVQVFQVDLLRLYLLEKSLNEISGIQLHGIKPLLSFELPLGDGRDYKNRVHKLALDLTAPGAYLLVVRGGDRIATGMVLKTDLRIEAQEQFDVGRIRVNVRQGDGYLAGAHVKVVGSGDGSFRSGDTDLRGVFVGDGLVGMATVIAKKGEHYAFYRGNAVHQPARFHPAPDPAQQEVEGKPGAERKGKDFDALEQNKLLNEGNRNRQVDWLKKEVYDKQQRGVEVYRTK